MCLEPEELTLLCRVEKRQVGGVDEVEAPGALKFGLGSVVEEYFSLNLEKASDTSMAQSVRLLRDKSATCGDLSGRQRRSGDSPP